MIGLQQVLLGSSDITDIVQQRIANGEMPQDYARPFIVWDIASEVGEGTLACKPSFDDVRFRVNCYSRDAKQARQLVDAARDAIEDAYTTDVTILQLGKDPDTKLWHWVADANSIELR